MEYNSIYKMRRQENSLFSEFEESVEPWILWMQFWESVSRIKRAIIDIFFSEIGAELLTDWNIQKILLQIRPTKRIRKKVSYLHETL